MARDGKMEEKIIDSDHLNTTIRVKIYFPKNFDSIYETNLVFMQDGNDYFQMGRVATLSDKLHQEEILANTVFIGIHYIDRKDRIKKYHPNGEEYHSYQLFLTEEVIPLMDSLVPNNPLGTVRTLMGDSLAGTFAIVTALEYQNLFQKVIMQSPLVDETVLNIIENANDYKLNIYHSIGLKETKVWTTQHREVDFVTPNEELARILRRQVTNYEYVQIAEGNHTWKHWQQEMPDVLERMLG